MGNLLENLIKQEIEEAISILKRKKIIQEAGPQENDPFADPNGMPASPDANAPLEDPNAGASGDLAGGDLLNASPGDSTDPNADPMADTSAEADEELPEEEKDPIDAAFDEIEDLSKKTEDITKIIKIIKAKKQSDFDSEEEAEQLINKIEDEGSPRMKKALTRPELKVAKI